MILPKLILRLAEYLEGAGSVEGFRGFLEAKAEEIIVILKVHATHVDTVVEFE